MKKILSVFLAAMMIMSVMVIAPISVSAVVTNTFDITDYENTETFRISTADDMMNFAAAVDSGKDFAGKTVTLEENIDLAGKEWKGIGYNNATWKYFCGTFDGQFYTISNMNPVTGNYDRRGCLFNSLAGAAVVKNFTLEGTFTMTKTASGNNSYYGSVAARVGGSDVYDDKGVLIQNVHSSVNFDGSHFEDVSATNCGLFYVGGMVGYMNSGDKAKLTIDNCIYDGRIVCNASAGGGNRPYFFGGFIAYTGHRNAEADRYLTIKNSVYAGDISLVSGNHVGAIIGGISDYNASNQTTFNYVEIENVLAIGTVSCSGSSADYNGELIGAFGKRYKNRNEADVAPVGQSHLTMTNVYYVDVAVSDSMFGSEDTEAPRFLTNVAKKTKDEILAFDASTAGLTGFAFKEGNELNTYYPCPASLASAEGWIDSLTVGGNAGILGGAIRCTEQGDVYSGLRFVAMFNNSKAGIANGGAADANFGIILISKAKYDVAADTTTVAGLVTAGGVKVEATKVDTETVEGYTRVSAVIYKMDKLDYTKEVVAVAYVGDTLVGASDCESIYSVAQKCVEQNNDTPEAIAFAKEILSAVGTN